MREITKNTYIKLKKKKFERVRKLFLRFCRVYRYKLLLNNKIEKKRTDFIFFFPIARMSYRRLLFVLVIYFL